VKKCLKSIAKKEGIKVTEEGLKALIYIANGDLRKATNSLQVAASLDKEIDADTIYKSTGFARPEEVKKLIDVSLGGAFTEARDILKHLLIDYGLSGQDIIIQVHRSIYELPLQDVIKVELVDKVGETEFRITSGGNPRIQLEALLAHFTLIGKRAMPK
jgi:replication factor C small subunit